MTQESSLIISKLIRKIKIVCHNDAESSCDGCPIAERGLDTGLCDYGVFVEADE